MQEIRSIRTRIGRNKFRALISRALLCNLDELRLSHKTPIIQSELMGGLSW